MAMASSSISLMASQTLILQNPPSLHHPLKPSILSLPKPSFLRSSKFPSLSLSNPKKSLIVASSSSSATEFATASSSESLLTGSTRTVTTVFAIAVAVSKLFAQRLCDFALKLDFQRSVLSTAGPLFFAASNDRRYLNTPLTVVAAGMAKWLDIYSGVLMIRVLLSWFPNIPWDRQPLSAIRDLCDPYLNLFRNIIPPVFNTLDISPLMAFAILGVLSGLLTGTKDMGSY